MHGGKFSLRYRSEGYRINLHCQSFPSERIGRPGFSKQTHTSWPPYDHVVFSFVFHQVLRSLAQDLDSDDLRPSVPTASFVDGEIHKGEDTKFPNLVFFDDFVLVVTAPTPQELIPKCARVLEKQQIRKSVCNKRYGS